MRIRLTAILAAALVAAGSPALAQDHYERGEGRYDRSDDRVEGRWGHAYGADLRARYERVEARIQRGLRDRTLSYREGDRLRSQLRGLRQLDRQYRASGGRLSRWEQGDLEQRLERLERQVRRERHDGDNRRY